MTNRKLLQRVSLASLVAVASIPAFMACGGASGSGAATPSASAPPGYGPPPPGYGQAPPGYPQQQQPAQYPQQTYPQQQPVAQQPGAYPAPGNGYPQQPAPAQQGAPPGATAVSPSPAPAASAPTAPLGSVFTTDPNQLAQLFAQAAAAGQAMLQQPGQVPGDPVELGLAAAALVHAKGEQLQGQIAKATLQEGGHNEFMVTMQPGTCYTIIGFSPPGQVKNVDLHLLAPPFYNVLAGQDTTDNNAAFIGSTPNPMCPVIPLPLQYKVDITARSGSGAVGVGVYTKGK
jgi:hypothetical protein